MAAKPWKTILAITALSLLAGCVSPQALHQEDENCCAGYGSWW